WNVQFLCPEEALALVAGTDCSAVVLDSPLPGWKPEDLLEEIQRSAPGTPVMMRDPEATPAQAVRLARLGVQQFLPSVEDPFNSIETVVEEQRKGDLVRLAAGVENA